MSNYYYMKSCANQPYFRAFEKGATEALLSSVFEQWKTLRERVGPQKPSWLPTDTRQSLNWRF